MALDQMVHRFGMGGDDYRIVAVTDDYRYWKITVTKNGERFPVGEHGGFRTSVAWKGDARRTAIAANDEIERVSSWLVSQHVYGA